MSADAGNTGSFSFAALPVALGLAIAFAVCQIVLFFGLGFAVQALESALGYRGLLYDISGVATWVVFTWAHALFVLMVSDAARPQARHPNGFITALIGSVPLGAIFLTVSVLDATGSAYGCAEGVCSASSCS